MPTLEWGASRKLNWREEGSGPPLILVHGSPADGRAWNRVVPFLKDRFRLVMPDLPGYGASDPVPDEPEGRALMKLVPGARMEAIAGGNHGMLDFHPEAVAKHIAA